MLAYVDTGATLCLAQQQALPQRYWTLLEKPILVRIANIKTIKIQHKAVNLVLLIEGKRFPLPSLYMQDAGLPIIIG